MLKKTLESNQDTRPATLHGKSPASPQTLEDKWGPMPAPLPTPPAGATSWWKWAMTWFLISALGVVVVLSVKGCFSPHAPTSTPSKEATPPPTAKAPTPIATETRLITFTGIPSSVYTDTPLTVTVQLSNVKPEEVILKLVLPDQSEIDPVPDSVTTAENQIQATFNVGDNPGIAKIEAHLQDEVFDSAEITIQKAPEITIDIQSIPFIEAGVLLSGYPAAVTITVQEEVDGKMQPAQNRNVALSSEPKVFEEISLTTGDDGKTNISISIQTPQSGPLTINAIIKDSNGKLLYTQPDTGFQVIVPTKTVVQSSTYLLNPAERTPLIGDLNGFYVEKVKEFRDNNDYVWIILKGYVAPDCFNEISDSININTKCNKAFYLSEPLQIPYVNIKIGANGHKVLLIERDDKTQSPKILIVGLIKSDSLSP